MDNGFVHLRFRKSERFSQLRARVGWRRNWYLNRILRISVDYGHTNFLGGAVNADRAAERVILARFQINFI